MLRRSILELARRRSLNKLPTQKPPVQNGTQKLNGTVGKTTEAVGVPLESGSSSSSNVWKVVVGGVLVGGGGLAYAYQKFYLDPRNNVEKLPEFDGRSDTVLNGVGGLEEKVVVNDQDANVSKEDVGTVEKDKEVGVEKDDRMDSSRVSDESKVNGESQVQEGVDATLKEDVERFQKNVLSNLPQGGTLPDDQVADSKTLPEDTSDKKEDGDGITGDQRIIEQNEVGTSIPSSQETKVISEETEAKAPTDHHVTEQKAPEAPLVDSPDSSSSLTGLYHLGEKNEDKNATSLDGEVDVSVPQSKSPKDPIGITEELRDGDISKDGKLVLDFLEAIHAAEKRQAELDAHILAEEKRTLKEKYEKQLRDARARELMFAEAAEMLNEELNKEKTNAALTVKTLQEKADEDLKVELERKDNEAKMLLNKVKELAKAELAAAIASEKASQIEKLSEANLNIDALCMAFYARSEEARQSHSVHKLALGALALEDALSKGLPIQTEISVLHTYLEGIDKDSLLNLVLSSLPEETLNHGTETILQLNQKFDTLKKALRHYSLIPPNGGGILTHAVASIASGIKVKENETSGEGIESLISRVENLLAEGKLAEAADTLERGVNGSQAEEFVGDWVKKARDRAITEQALTLLQSYATSISVT
ncbi:MICOS complex subunit mic60 [Ranunculus cassubicifolius]